MLILLFIIHGYIWYLSHIHAKHIQALNWCSLSKIWFSTLFCNSHFSEINYLIFFRKALLSKIFDFEHSLLKLWIANTVLRLPWLQIYFGKFSILNNSPRIMSVLHISPLNLDSEHFAMNSHDFEHLYRKLMIVDTSRVKLKDDINNNVNNSLRKLSLQTLFIEFTDSQ